MKDILSQLQTYKENRIANANFHMDTENRKTNLRSHKCHFIPSALEIGQNVQISWALSISASLSVFYVLAILYLQSFLFSYLQSLSSALNKLSCNATPGAVSNVLLLALAT